MSRLSNTSKMSSVGSSPKTAALLPAAEESEPSAGGSGGVSVSLNAKAGGEGSGSGCGGGGDGTGGTTRYGRRTTPSDA